MSSNPMWRIARGVALASAKETEMKGWAIALASLLLLAAAPSAHAERNLYNYKNQDAGTLVTSFSVSNWGQGGALIERSDWTGSIQIDSSPRPGEHDFSEDFDSNKFILSSGLTGFDNDTTKYFGKVEIVKLPPGKYHFWRAEKEFPVLGRLEPNYSEFEIQTGRTTYVGAFRSVALFGKNRIGIRTLLYYATMHLNMADRDLAIAKSVGINVDDPIIIGPDTPAANPSQ